MEVITQGTDKVVGATRVHGTPTIKAAGAIRVTATRAVGGSSQTALVVATNKDSVVALCGVTTIHQGLSLTMQVVEVGATQLADLTATWEMRLQAAANAAGFNSPLCPLVSSCA